MVSLRRRADRRLVAGVAGGIADSLNASVVFVRIAVGLAVALTPWAIWAYAAAALLLPARGERRPGWDNLVALGRTGLVFLAPRLALPGNIDPSGATGPVGVWLTSIGLLLAGAVVFVASGYAPREPGGARRAVIASLPAVVAALLLSAGVLTLDQVRWEVYVPLAALAGGVALLVAARRGRWRAYTCPALLALAAAGVIVASGARLEGGVGDVRANPAPQGDEPAVIRRAAGDVTVDLARFARGASPAALEVSVGVGDVDITVPRGTQLELTARVGRGELYTGFGAGSEHLHGFDLRVERHIESRATRPGPVKVAVDVGLGSLYINRGDG
jgi:phage shock protein PspC (stress-responsive transcriptional regulator)